MQFFRVRETSMKMAEILTGARKTYGLNLIGGIRRDLLKEDMIQTRQLAQQMRRDVQELVDMLLSTPNMEQRTVGIGRLDPEIARDFSNVGPMVRASGHARDTRADHPFVGYGLLPMEVHSEQGCDVISRLKVRINEVYTSLNMIDFGLDNLPGGPLMVEGFTYIPHRFALGFAEAPRGDDIHWSMTGDNQKLYRWRCRAATYANWPTLRDQRAQQLPLGSDIWLLGVIGFGLLAGIIPLHGWVPQAHANASAPAAALFSTVVMKIGLLGILTLSLLGGNAPLWWGVALLVLGMITAFVGGLYALMEHNIQRLLAYHTLENIGIILLGLGAGVTGIALNQPVLIALGLTGGLYHLLNHSLFKSVLFLGAGSIWFRTGHRDIEKLGGIGKRMPVISIAMLVGLMAMAALPPLNGFAGEWVIYQSFFKLGNSGAFVGRLLGPLLAVGLAITGALAVMCMAKVYGVTFLGAPRTKEAENASCAPILMGVSVVALAICCVIGGVAAPWLLPMISTAVPLPLETAHTTVSQPMITLLLVACPLLPFIIMAIFKGNRLPSRSRGAAWVCGYDHEQSMVITAHGFAMPVKEAFAPVLKLRKWLNPVSLVPGWQNAAAAVLFRRLALIELAVLVVIVVSRGA